MSTLTIEKVMEMKRLIDSMGPPPKGVDLYPHWLGLEQAFEINVRGTGDRRMVIVHNDRIDAVYRALRDAGVDVRLRPRYGMGSENDAGAKS